MKQMVQKGIVFGAILIVLNNILSFVLIPIGGASEVMWNDYYKVEELDTLYVGSSVCLRSFNPYILDEELGTNSFNMGTPAQPIDLTYLALQTAIERHDIKRVYFGFGYFTLTMTSSPQAEAAFLQARNQHVPLGERMKANVGYAFDKKNIGSSRAINFMIPWVYNHVELHGGAIVNNVLGKLNGRTAADEMMVNDELRNYVGRGFGYYKGVMNYETADTMNSKMFYYGEFIADALGMLNRICRLCEANDIELIVVNTPRPVFDTVSYGEEYYNRYEMLKAFLNERGAEYYDFNLVKPEIYESRPEYYFNFEHLNQEGAEAFSRSLAKFEMLRHQQDSMEEYFFDWEEYLEFVQ